MSCLEQSAKGSGNRLTEETSLYEVLSTEVTKEEVEKVTEVNFSECF
jgi:hypothetical protein